MGSDNHGKPVGSTPILGEWVIVHAKVAYSLINAWGYHPGRFAGWPVRVLYIRGAISRP